MSDYGWVPVDGIPLTVWKHSATPLFHLVGDLFSDGLTAGQLKEEMDNVQWDDLSVIKTRLDGAGSYLTGGFQTKLSSILDKLNDAYQGAANDVMASRFQQAQNTATSLGPTFTELGSRVDDIDTALTACAKSVGGYSRLGSDVSNVTSAFGFGDSEDDKARKAWKTCANSFQSTGSAMPYASTNPGGFDANVSPTPVQTRPPAAVPNPGAVGPGPGPGGTVTTPHIKPPPILHVKPGPTTKPPPFKPHPITSGPGGYGPGGDGPGSNGPGGYGPGGPGAGLDTGTSLAGYSGPGPGFGGPGPGLDGGAGPGGGYGDGTSLAGAGGGLGGAAGGAGAAAGAGGRGGAAGVPMGARGGGGGSGSDSDRERSTWLSEDDDVWGGGESDAPDGVVS